MVPPLPRLLADDATPEALASLHGRPGRPHRPAVGRGRRVRHDGRPLPGRRRLPRPLPQGPCRRRAAQSTARAAPAEYIERPALTVGLAVQPDVLRKLTDQPGFRGRGPARPLPVCAAGQHRRPAAGSAPAGRCPRRSRSATGSSCMRWPGPCSTRREAARLVGSEDPIILTLVPPRPRSGVLEFEAEIEPRLHPHHGDLAHIADWAAKLVGAVARIAGLLHLAARLRDGWAQPVNQATITDADRHRPLPHRSRPGRVRPHGRRRSHPRRCPLPPGLDRADRSEGLHPPRAVHRPAKGPVRQGRRARPAPWPCWWSTATSARFPRRNAAPGPGRPASPGFEVNPLWRR